MRHYRALFVKTFLIATVFLLVFVALFGTTPKISDAVLSQNYINNVSEKKLDWHFGENFLDIKSIKAIVESWKTDNTFELEKIKADPIVIAVIDTGVNFQHEMFEGKYDAEGKSTSGDGVGKYDVFFRDNAGKIIGKNTVIPSGSIEDNDGSAKHGTHVNGIIATLIHALDLEEYIKILPIKASSFSKGSSSFALSNVKDGIDFALENGADIINMSLGAYTTGWSNFITAEHAKKAVFVAAAGNDAKSSASLNGQFYPAANSDVIGVMNYSGNPGRSPTLASNSNYGSAYDICAPGSEIFSVNGETNDSYKSMSGTSMASPIIAFASALVTMKYRAQEIANNYEITPPVVKMMMSAHTKKIITKDKLKLPVLDLKSLIEIDFINDEQYSYVTDIEPSSISITSDRSPIFELGDIGSVNFQCNIVPLGAEGKNVVKWTHVVDGKEANLGEGKDLQFTPPNEVGEYIIKASLVGTNISATTKVIVKYKVIAPEQAEVRLDKDISNDNRIALGETITFSLKDFEFVDKQANSVLWYVDGKYASFGEKFEYSSLRVGEHVISVKFNNVVLPIKFKVVVDENLPFDIFKVYTEYELFTLAFLSFVALVLASVILTILVKGKKLGIYESNPRK